MTHRARGLSDAADGSNAFPGAMQVLTNLILSPSTPGLYVPRPAAVTLTSFGGFTVPAGVTALKVFGNLAYGFISSGAFSGKDEPFAYNLATNTFLTITGELAANLPDTQPTTGDWQPPSIDRIASRILFTHPGFGTGAVKFGWLDISGFTSASITGTTHTSTLIDGLSANPITAGWMPGMTITGAGIVAATTIVSLGAASVVLSQATVASSGGVVLTVTGGTAASPQWSAGDTNGNNLITRPAWVAQFNGRAWFAVADGVQFSDAGNATQITNITQAVTFNNGINVNALAGLGLYSATQGGIVQSLMCFQQAAVIQQITGDQSTTNLVRNALNVQTGTLAPNTLAPTPQGLAFVAPDGLRLLDQNANVSNPIGAHGKGVNLPFLYAIAPSRMCAAFSGTTYRVTVKNGNVNGQPVQEYWLDTDTNTWTGPHSFPASVIQPWTSTTSATFVMAAVGIDAKLWQSDVQVSSASTYTENGAAMAWAWQTVLLPDNQDECANAVIESTLGVQLPGGTAQMTIQALNESGSPLGTLFIAGSGSTATVWNAFTWGAAPWGGNTGYFTQVPLPWADVLTFKQMSLRITGSSIAGFALGNFYMKVEHLDYQLTGVQ